MLNKTHCIELPLDNLIKNIWCLFQTSYTNYWLSNIFSFKIYFSTCIRCDNKGKVQEKKQTK